MQPDPSYHQSYRAENFILFPGIISEHFHQSISILISWNQKGTFCQSHRPGKFYSLFVASKWNNFTNQFYINHLQNIQS